MPEPTGDDLAAVRARRTQLRDKYLRDKSERPATTARGIHHAAFVCKNVEETIRFYQGLLGFPLVELVENRDYAGSGLDHEAYRETIGALQHMAISVTSDAFETARAKLEAENIEYLGPDRGADDSLYFRDPNGMGIELYREELGKFEGTELL
jgi:glyoxylase I family protein